MQTKQINKELLYEIYRLLKKQQEMDDYEEKIVCDGKEYIIKKVLTFEDEIITHMNREYPAILKDYSLWEEYQSEMIFIKESRGHKYYRIENPPLYVSFDNGYYRVMNITLEPFTFSSDREIKPSDRNVNVFGTVYGDEWKED